MNRPSKENKYKSNYDKSLYLLDEQYVGDLEKYCDELEKALDKAIKTLTELDHEMYKDDNCQMSEKDWKEWLLSDE